MSKKKYPKYSKHKAKKNKFEPKNKKDVQPKADNKTPLSVIVLTCVLIAIVTAVSFQPVHQNGLTNWDDNKYVAKFEVRENTWYPGNDLIVELSWENTKKIFSTLSFMGNYHPLTMLSYNIDYQISGVSASSYLRTNLILHVITTLLIFWFVFLFFSNFPMAAIAAFLFGVGTIHVESVAWASERKDVLYALFFVASLISYTYYLRKGRQARFFILSIFLFILSLLSKGQAVSLAVTLVILDWFEGRKLISDRVIIEKIPFFALAICFGVIAIMAQQQGDAIRDIEEFAFYNRIAFAAYGLTQYVIKMIVPLNFAALYPYPSLVEGQIPVKFWFYLLPASLLVLAFIKAFKKKNKFVVFGIAFFVVNVFLVLQLLPVGSAIMADRYTYIPSIGFYILVGYGYWRLVLANKKLQIPLLVAVIAFGGVQAYSTTQQCKVWNNSVTMWNNTIKISPDASVAWNNRGSAKDKLAKTTLPVGERVRIRQDAMIDFTEAVKLNPKYYHAFYNRGTSKKDCGLDTHDSTWMITAIADFNKALQINSKFAEAYHNRGVAKENLIDFRKQNPKWYGHIVDSIAFRDPIADYSRGISLDGSLHSLYTSRGVAIGKTGDLQGAIVDFNRSLQLKPQSPETYSNRGYAKVLLGKHKEGIADYNIALRMRNPYPDALYNRGMAKYNMADYSGAITDLNTVLAQKPELVAAYFYRGISKYKMSDFESAIKDLSVSIEKQNNIVNAVYYRGMCFMMIGKRNEACNDFSFTSKYKLKEGMDALKLYCSGN